MELQNVTRTLFLDLLGAEGALNVAALAVMLSQLSALACFIDAKFGHAKHSASRSCSQDSVLIVHVCHSGAGVFGVEMFLLENGEILLNEVAPRPHNSGHYTIEGCATSQFEQHLRAVMGWPLGSPDLLVNSW